MPGKIIISVSNDVIFDQRVMKIARALSESGSELLILGCFKESEPDFSDEPFDVKLFKMIFKKGFLFYKWLNIKIFFYLLLHRADLLLANDLDTLLPNYLISRLKGIKLVYDSHEYFTGMPELADRSAIRKFWKYIESKTVPHIKYMMTVSESIGELYRIEYGVSPVIIRNLSRETNFKTVERDKICPDKDSLLLVQQGTWNNNKRGLSELLEVVRITSGLHLMVIGEGVTLQALKDKTVDEDYSDRVTFLPQMRWEDMMAYTRVADIGFSLEKDDSLSYKYSLPNKIFDYINAGIGIIASDIPEIRNVINDHSCGLLVDEVSVDAIQKKVILLKEDPQLLDSLKLNSKKAFDDLVWEKEKVKVVELFTRAGLDFS